MATKEKKIVPPKLNKFMHARNPYKTPPSFKKLATLYPQFRAHCVYDVAGKVHLDFKNPNGLRALTTCLLRHDFGLEVTIPDDRLVPTLPLRLNYLLWLEDLLYLVARRSGGGGGEGSQGATPVLGVDVGTGAACVYPLLGAAHFSWCMLATETDPVSYSSARDNLERNGLTGQVAVRKVEDKTILKGVIDLPETLVQVSSLRPRTGGGGGGGGSGRKGPLSLIKSRGLGEGQRWGNVCTGAKEGNEEHNKDNTEDKEENCNGKEGKEDRNGKEGKDRNETEKKRDYVFDFTMANPPFFSSEEEVDTMAKSKKGRGEPSAAPTGSTQEKVTEGGEVEFIRQMIEESQLLRDKVRIFTTLIGTKAHVKEVKRLVEAAKPTSSVFTEFCQGRTMRWGAAWTFAAGTSLSEVRSKKEMATNKPIVLLLPRTLMSVYSVPAAWSKVQTWLKALKVKIEVFKSTKYFVSVNVKAFKLTWLHQRRRRREKERDGQQERNGKSCAKEEEEEDTASSSKRTQEEDDEEEGRENKRARIATEEEMEETGQDMEEEEEEDLDEEELDDEEESHKEAKLTDKDDQQGATGGWAERKPTKGGLKCILKCNFQVKQTGGLISVEAYYLGGSLGKDGLNQLVQYMRNQLSNPHA